MRAILIQLLFALLMLAPPVFAVNSETVQKLAFGESDDKVAAVASLVAEGDERAAAGHCKPSRTANCRQRASGFLLLKVTLH